MSQELTESLNKDNNECNQNNDSPKEIKLSEPKTTEVHTKKLTPSTSEIKETETKKAEESNKFIANIKNSINNLISLTKQEEKKEEAKKELEPKKEEKNEEEKVDTKKEDDKKEDEEKEEAKKEENSQKKEENKNIINVPKDGEENKNIINFPKAEEKKHPKKEQNKFDYIFPIPNPNLKSEESKNSDPSYLSYKIPPNNFGSLNLKIPNNLRPKNKDQQNQNQNRLNFNLSYFSPITISCSINAHSVKRSKLRPKEKEQEFFEKIIKISDVSNVQEFWEVFQHLLKPNQCPVGSDYHIFKKGIVPMWEDKQNKDGGKLSVLLTWKYANVLWEEVTFNFAKGLLPYYDYINGIVISTRPKFLVLSFWIKCGNNAMVEKIRNALSGFLQAPSSNCFDFIPFH